MVFIDRTNKPVAFSLHDTCHGISGDLLIRERYNAGNLLFGKETMHRANPAKWLPFQIIRFHQSALL